MARAKNGEAISPRRRRGKDLQRLRALLSEASVHGDLSVWRRAKAVLGYIQGKSVIQMSKELDTERSAINRWLAWYDADGADGLRTRKPPGAAPRLSDSQREELIAVIEAGPQSAGYSAGIWTGPMIGQWIQKRFGVRYHNHYVPALLHQLGFSVQRPRKRLARADLAAQDVWMRERLPAIKKKRRDAVVSFSSRTRRVSGSMGRSTERGRELAFSPASTPTDSERPPMSSEPSA
jgi:transposase